MPTREAVPALLRGRQRHRLFDVRSVHLILRQVLLELAVVLDDLRLRQDLEDLLLDLVGAADDDDVRDRVHVLARDLLHLARVDGVELLGVDLPVVRRQIVDQGLAEPVGAVIGYVALAPFLSPFVYAITFAMIAGAMVFLALDELLPTAREYGQPHLSIYGLIGGMMVMAISLLLFM